MLCNHEHHTAELLGEISCNLSVFEQLDNLKYLETVHVTDLAQAKLYTVGAFINELGVPWPMYAAAVVWKCAGHWLKKWRASNSDMYVLLKKKGNVLKSDVVGTYYELAKGPADLLYKDSFYNHVSFGCKVGLNLFYKLTIDDVEEIFKDRFKMLNHSLLCQLSEMSYTLRLNVLWMIREFVHDTEDFSEVVEAIRRALNKKTTLAEKLKKICKKSSKAKSPTSAS